ncbi:hypothetical protein SAMN04515667_0671 [Formosa sp. Hel1_31_208]|uniref:hypothetical protein n=1 Tax=Formosa sp. Hel1_31_208 TaxID=1798225 RepID=UPI00087A4EDD|nr:hypothetical protein [Formosa sp. Hel1_31_208]SDR78976.1 hypothetical protein SAMN04515667_0671 [Formosa sp. Hel1_31_208]
MIKPVDYQDYTIKLIVLGCCFLFSNTVMAQAEDDTYLFEAYKNYSKLPRETAYGHLNKTTLLNGESLGFSIYIFDKYTKKPSEVTSNVYCSIETETGKVLKSKLILATEGVASGLFNIDSTFASGNYIFKGYTNWMKNFDEQNFYVQNIKIINPNDYNAPNKMSDSGIDAQFLPEGGHLILNTQNTMGVVIKNEQGFGIRNLEGIVLDNTGSEITNFKTNDFGISKFNIIPETGKTYSVILNSEDSTPIVLQPAENRGINMSVTDLGKRVALVFRTNASTLSDISNKKFKLSFSNGSQLKVIDLVFNDKTEIARLINYSDLYPGINIITLFDETNKPVLERLFFKHDGIERLFTGKETIKQETDSLVITIPVSGIDKTKPHNFSVSVLPANTKSYRGHHNIISYTYLQPYLNGYVENAKYYFTKVDRKKTLELDNLLLTQGWSSYDWNTIFNYDTKANYAFENGISLTANLNNTKAKQFIIYPLNNSSTITMNVPDGESSFNVKGLRPFEDEMITIGAVEKKNRVLKPSLYAQFTPSKVPNLNRSFSTLDYNETTVFRYNPEEPILDSSWKDIEELGEVLIVSKRDEERIEKIKSNTIGQIDFLTDVQRDSYTTFGNYISTKGFNVFQNATTLTITNTRRTTLGSSSPIIYLDGLLLFDNGILLNLDMSIVDYVQIDKSGLGEGIRGAGGVIRIVTDPQLRTERYNNNPEAGLKVKPPLAFATQKKFYTPAYTYYKSTFFQNYGVIDWFPNLKADDNGNLTLKVKNTKNNQFKLFIEGVGNFGTFLVNEKIITIN